MLNIIAFIRFSCLYVIIFTIKVKPIPIKKTWRRPWKKKKEREKKQPVKRVRRVKRRRIVVPKKSVIHIDPRNGPPVSLSFKFHGRNYDQNYF